ncbi:hypothetical protein Tco_1347697, partial [Tanacetum coccineum]
MSPYCFKFSLIHSFTSFFRDLTYLRFALGYPLYLIFDMYDPDYGSFSNHFWSQAGIFNDSERDQIVLSNVGIMVVLYAFYRKVVKKAEARDAVKPILGDYYKLDDTPMLKALWRDTKCIYVEPDENSEVK